MRSRHNIRNKIKGRSVVKTGRNYIIKFIETRLGKIIKDKDPKKNKDVKYGYSFKR